LGRGITGGGLAVPYFNGFMNAFLKDKPKETFPSVPSMPAEIRALMERNKREEREKLARAELLAAKTGAVTDAETTAAANEEAGTGINVNTIIEVERPRTSEPPPPTRVPTPAVVPQRTPEQTKPQPNPPPSEGTRRKGKKGDG